MIANYHTHSRWCGHAVGEIEDYIRTALSEGFEELAVTEHVPHRGDPDRHRMPWADFLPFNRALNRAIEEYGDRISLLKGFECEYMPERMDDYRMFREEYGYGIMILGHHNVGPDHSIFMFARNKPDYAVRMYADEVCEGLETGFFDFLAHPELLLMNYAPGFDKESERSLRQIYACCEKLHIPVEINGAGYVSGRPYPSAEALEMSKEYDLTYIINMDAHDPELLTKPYYSQVEAFASRLGIDPVARYFADRH